MAPRRQKEPPKKHFTRTFVKRNCLSVNRQGIDKHAWKEVPIYFRKNQVLIPPLPNELALSVLNHLDRAEFIRLATVSPGIGPAAQDRLYASITLSMDSQSPHPTRLRLLIRSLLENYDLSGCIREINAQFTTCPPTCNHGRQGRSLIPPGQRVPFAQKHMADFNQQGFPNGRRRLRNLLQLLNQGARLGELDFVNCDLTLFCVLLYLLPNLQRLSMDLDNFGIIRGGLQMIFKPLLQNANTGYDFPGLQNLEAVRIRRGRFPGGMNNPQHRGFFTLAACDVLAVLLKLPSLRKFDCAFVGARAISNRTSWLGWTSNITELLLPYSALPSPNLLDWMIRCPKVEKLRMSASFFYGTPLALTPNGFTVAQLNGDHHRLNNTNMGVHWTPWEDLAAALTPVQHVLRLFELDTWAIDWQAQQRETHPQMDSLRDFQGLTDLRLPFHALSGHDFEPVLTFEVYKLLPDSLEYLQLTDDRDVAHQPDRQLYSNMDTIYNVLCQKDRHGRFANLRAIVLWGWLPQTTDAVIMSSRTAVLAQRLGVTFQRHYLQGPNSFPGYLNTESANWQMNPPATLMPLAQASAPQPAPQPAAAAAAAQGGQLVPAGPAGAVVPAAPAVPGFYDIHTATLTWALRVQPENLRYREAQDWLNQGPWLR